MREPWSLIDYVQARSRELGIPAVDREDGLILHATAALLASRFGSLRVFEGGSGIGYSTLWILTALHGSSGNGIVYATDRSRERLAEVEAYARRLGLLKYLRTIPGDSVEIAKGLSEGLHMVFIDVEKERYIDLFEAVEGKVIDGGAVLAHNMYYPDPESALRYMQHVRAKKGWMSVVLPTPAGLSLSVKSIGRNDKRRGSADDYYQAYAD